MSDSVMSVLVFAVGSIAVPLAFVSAWNLFKGLSS